MFTVTKQFKQGTAVVSLSLENQGNVKVALEAIDQAAAEAELKAGASRAKATKKKDEAPKTTTDAAAAPAPEPTANALAGAVPAAPVPTPAAPAVPAPTPAAPVAAAPATENPVAAPQVQMEAPAPVAPTPAAIPQAEAAADPMATQWRQAFGTMVDNVKAITPDNLPKLEAAAVQAMANLNVPVNGLDHARQVLEGFSMEHVKPFYDYVANQVMNEYPNHQ